MMQYYCSVSCCGLPLDAVQASPTVLHNVTSQLRRHRHARVLPAMFVHAQLQADGCLIMASWQVTGSYLPDTVFASVCSRALVGLTTC